MGNESQVITLIIINIPLNPEHLCANFAQNHSLEGLILRATYLGNQCKSAALNQRVGS